MVVVREPDGGRERVVVRVREVGRVAQRVGVVWGAAVKGEVCRVLLSGLERK